MGTNVLRMRLVEHCAKRVIGENCAKRERLGKQCPERERVGEHCAEREIGEHCT